MYTVMGAQDELQVGQGHVSSLKTEISERQRLLPPPPQVSPDDSNASFLNQTWSLFCSSTGIQ